MGRAKEEAPKAYSLRLTEKALQDLDNITGYIAYIKHQPLNAIRVGDEILKTIERIGKNPSAFRECEEMPTINKIYRKAVCLSWLIIYKIKPTEIVILGIIHGHRRKSKIKDLRKVKY
jgi:plasmid stabilization system protein ParE